MRLVSNYPSYTELIELISKYPDAIRLNVFMDFKNSAKLLYDETVVRNLMESYSSTGEPNLKIFSSWLDFVTDMYTFSYNQNIDVHIYTIADNGEYQYHKTISKDYKSNRLVSKSKTSPYLASDEFHKILMYNTEAIMQASKYMHNTHGIYLKYCESDFVSYYIISKYFDRDDCINLICTTDKDMIQTMIFKNVVQYVQIYNKESFFRTKDNWCEAYQGMPEVPVDRYIYMKSIMGDRGDGIPGVGGVGPVRAANIVNMLEKTPESIDEFEEQLSLLATNESDEYKYVRKANEEKETVRRNYKLVCFEELMKNLTSTVTNIMENVHNNENKWGMEDTTKFINKMQKKVAEDTSM